jgi:hypothetical protein
MVPWNGNGTRFTHPGEAGFRFLGQGISAADIIRAG